jgi:hypothetical protein
MLVSFNELAVRSDCTVTPNFAAIFESVSPDLMTYEPLTTSVVVGGSAGGVVVPPPLEEPPPVPLPLDPLPVDPLPPVPLPLVPLPLDPLPEPELPVDVVDEPFLTISTWPGRMMDDQLSLFSVSTDCVLTPYFAAILLTVSPDLTVYFLVVLVVLVAVGEVVGAVVPVDAGALEVLDDVSRRTWPGKMRLFALRPLSLRTLDVESEYLPAMPLTVSPGFTVYFEGTDVVDALAVIVLAALPRPAVDGFFDVTGAASA